jgi:hypothetical protein
MEQLELFLYGTHNSCFIGDKSEPRYFYYLGMQEKLNAPGMLLYNCLKCRSTLDKNSILPKEMVIQR